MRKFLSKSIFVALPFMFITVVTVFINPYDYPYWNGSKTYHKYWTTESINKDSRLSVAVKALSIQESTVFIGDSRTDQLFNNTSDSISKAINLAVGGLCFNEIIELSWHVIENNPDISNIYIGLNFNHFGNKNHLTLMSEAIESVSNPLHFVLNKHNFKSSWSLFTVRMKNNVVSNRVAKSMHNQFITEDEFWTYQIESAARNFYEKMQPNPNLKNELDSLVRGCQKRNIHVGFFSPPTHVQLQKQPERWGVSYLKQDFVNILSNLPAPYVNLDRDSKFTRDSSNFKDPFHLAKNHELVLREIVQALEYRSINLSKD